jgi:BMFP domain-containing protein YqiC
LHAVCLPHKALCDQGLGGNISASRTGRSIALHQDGANGGTVARAWGTMTRAAGPSAHGVRDREEAMLNARTLDELAARIGKALEGSPVKDVEKNVKAMLASGLARLDLVTRQEFDTQAEVLRKTREKVERLELLVAELEARVTPPPPPVV